VSEAELTADRLREVFDAAAPLTVGVEEELMLLDPGSFDLVPSAAGILARLGGDRRFKLELPAAQLEIVTAAHDRVAGMVDELALARADLAAAAQEVRPAAAGVHPFAAQEGELNRGPRHDHTAREYGAIARRQLVHALQVHVAPGAADRALAVYNALRSYLPELAALAANAPFHDGRDTGLASVRPKISEMLPRQGVPPILAGWDDYVTALRWGIAAEVLPEVGCWWWELRPHPAFGTLELRVPDAQTTVGEAGAIAATAQALVAWLGDRHDLGETLPVAPSWRIGENRWSAARDGVQGTLADLETGERRPTADRLLELLDRLAPTAERLGCGAQLEQACELARRNGAMRQRAVARDSGVAGIARWLAESWLSPGPQA